MEDGDKFLSDRVVQSYTDAAKAKQAAQDEEELGSSEESASE